MPEWSWRGRVPSTKGLENELQDLEIAHHRCTPPETGARGWDVADLKNDAGKIWKRQQAGGIYSNILQ